MCIRDRLRITSDCPLIDPNIVDKVIEKYLTKDYDYVSNTLIRTFPIGTDSEIFSFDILEKSWQNASLLSEKEHVTPYIYLNPEKFKIKIINQDENLSHLRWSLDYEKDLFVIREIIKNIPQRPILMTDIVQFLNKNPEIKNLNNIET